MPERGLYLYKDSMNCALPPPTVHMAHPHLFHVCLLGACYGAGLEEEWISTFHTNQTNNYVMALLSSSYTMRPPKGSGSLNSELFRPLSSARGESPPKIPFSSLLLLEEAWPLALEGRIWGSFL